MKVVGVALILFGLACRLKQAPVLTFSVVALRAGGYEVDTHCPEGYIGAVTWHTYDGMSKEDQLAQFKRDAQRGVCESVIDGGGPDVPDGQRLL